MVEVALNAQNIRYDLWSSHRVIHVQIQHDVSKQYRIRFVEISIYNYCFGYKSRIVNFSVTSHCTSQTYRKITMEQRIIGTSNLLASKGVAVHSRLLYLPDFLEIIFCFPNWRYSWKESSSIVALFSEYQRSIGDVPRVSRIIPNCLLLREGCIFDNWQRNWLKRDKCPNQTSILDRWSSILG